MSGGPENQNWEMNGKINIDDRGEIIKISIDTGASLERFSISRNDFDHVEKVAQLQGMPTDVFIDRAVSKYGFEKDLFDRILTEETPGSEPQK